MLESPSNRPEPTSYGGLCQTVDLFYTIYNLISSQIVFPFAVKEVHTAYGIRIK